MDKYEAIYHVPYRTQIGAKKWGSEERHTEEFVCTCGRLLTPGDTLTLTPNLASQGCEYGKCPGHPKEGKDGTSYCVYDVYCSDDELRKKNLEGEEYRKGHA